MELFDRNSFELDPKTRALMEAAIEGLTKGKDSSISPDVILGHVSSINELELYDGRYKHTFEVHNELPKQIETPIQKIKSNEKPFKPHYDLGSDHHKSDDYLKVYQPLMFHQRMSDFLLPSLRFHKSLEAIDTLTSPEYWRVAVALGVVIGKQVTTPIHDQLHAEIYETAE